MSFRNSRKVCLWQVFLSCFTASANKLYFYRKCTYNFHKCHIQHAITFTVTVNKHLNMLLLGEMSNSCSCTEQYGC